MKIHGNEITTEELRADVLVAKAKGLSRQWAFCPETVEALLDLLDLYTQQNQDNAEENQKLREANRLQRERLVETEGREEGLKKALGQAFRNPVRTTSGEIAYLMTEEFKLRCTELTNKGA